MTQTSPIWLRLLLAALNLLSILSLVVWPGMIFASTMANDSGRLSHTAHQLILIMVIAYPLPVVWGNVVFWRGLRTATAAQLVRATALSSTLVLTGLIAWLLE